MGFREDREAIARRADAAERDLAAAQGELSAEKLRAVEVDDLRKRVDALTKERDALKVGVHGAWQKRALIGASVSFAVIAMLGAGLWTLRAASVRDEREITQLVTQVEAAEPRIAAAQAARDQALAETELANQTTLDETHRLERLLANARAEATGDVFLVTASVAATSGAAPTHSSALCALTIRENRGECVASVICDGERVFPIIEPIPTVICRRDADGTPISAVSTMPGHPAFLEYYAGRTLVLREPAGPWSATLRIRDEMQMTLR